MVVRLLPCNLSDCLRAESTPLLPFALPCYFTALRRGNCLALTKLSGHFKNLRQCFGRRLGATIGSLSSRRCSRRNPPTPAALSLGYEPDSPTERRGLKRLHEADVMASDTDDVLIVDGREVRGIRGGPAPRAGQSPPRPMGKYGPIPRRPKRNGGQEDDTRVSVASHIDCQSLAFSGL
jgi:hypothetical protein